MLRRLTIQRRHDLRKLAQRATTIDAMQNKTLNHAMKTTMLPNSETQARIRQLKLGVDFIKALTESGLPAFLMYRLHVAPGHVGHQQFDRVGANINYSAADRLHERV